MKNLISILFTIMLVMGLAGYANAASYEIEWAGSVWLDSSNTSETWSFNLDTDTLDVGNISAGDTINSATLEIYFYDDEEEGVQGPPMYSKTLEFADVTTDGVLALDDEEIETGTMSFDVLGLVSGDHSLNVLIEFLTTSPDDAPPYPGWSPMLSNFEVQSVKLSGDYSAVPIPGAAWLLGSGLLGMVGIQRRTRR